MPEYRIRAVIFKEGEHWVAQCLEYRYAIQTRKIEDMPRVLRDCLTAQILISRERGIEPFYGYEPAPRRYWEMYERATPMPEQTEAPESAPEVEMRVAA
jgi:hypothetical protein